MADFRRWFTVLAVIAVMAFAASAQVGSITGSANNLLACVATAAGTPELRPEGYTELAGDIVISCTGGPVLQVGATVPVTNIIVYMAPSVPITSRFLSGTASEALLIVDEAGSNIKTPVTGTYGPNAPQILCTSAQQQASGGSSCTAQVGLDPGNIGPGGQVEVAIVPGTAQDGQFGAPAPNVFQGKVGDYGVNSVAFYNVPVLPPASSGVSRTYRITNVRVPVPGGNLSGTLQAIISTNGQSALPVAGTAINIGIVGPAMQASVSPNKTNNPFQQCIPASYQLTANLNFTEGFATGFKTRVIPGGAYNNIPGNALGNVAYAAEGQNNSATGNNQNIPGGLYGGFALNTESGFIFPSLTGNAGVSSGPTFTAGLADYGTRLKAVFTNIPAGLTLYVSTTFYNAPAVIGGTSLSPFAVLVATNSGEATSDGTSFSPIAGTATGSDNLPIIALSANGSGVATAVWEITNSNPSAQDSVSFGVYISYTATSSTAANPYGLPITVLPLNAPVNNVSLSMAPEPGGGTFATSNATQGQIPTPRFAIVAPYQGQWTTIQLCQTTLLYPFVTGASGFDTGIAVANTSMDPFNTTNQNGSCTLYPYGVTVAAAGDTPFSTPVKGCDMIANPLPGTNCFGGDGTSLTIAAGTVGTGLASALLPGFRGYVIAICNFQYAHGYAAVTDLGIRNLWSSYLALELSHVGIGSGNAGRGNGIETLAH